MPGYETVLPPNNRPRHAGMGVLVCENCISEGQLQRNENRRRNVTAHLPPPKCPNLLRNPAGNQHRGHLPFRGCVVRV